MLGYLTTNYTLGYLLWASAGLIAVGYVAKWVIGLVRPSPTTVESPPAPSAVGTTIHADVASVQQMGGITAHTINVGPAPRTFRNRDLGDLPEYLRRFAGTATSIICPTGDREAADLAEEIKALLQNAGWKVDGVNYAMRVPPPPPGIGLNFTGADPNAHQWVEGLGQRLIALGFPVTYGMNSSGVHIFIGPA